MDAWVKLLVAVAVVTVIAIGLWKGSNALTRRGLTVRPVSMMDRDMTKIENRYRQGNAAGAVSDKSPDQT